MVLNVKFPFHLSEQSWMMQQLLNAIHSWRVHSTAIIKNGQKEFTFYCYQHVLFGVVIRHSPHRSLQIANWTQNGRCVRKKGATFSSQQKFTAFLSVVTKWYCKLIECTGELATNICTCFSRDVRPIQPTGDVRTPWWNSTVDNTNTGTTYDQDYCVATTGSQFDCCRRSVFFSTPHRRCV